MVAGLTFLNVLIHSHIHRVPTTRQALFRSLVGKSRPGDVLRGGQKTGTGGLLALDPFLTETTLRVV